MGSGDIRTRRGKIWHGTHGKTRPKGNKKRTPSAASAGGKPAGKAAK